MCLSQLPLKTIKVQKIIPFSDLTISNNSERSKYPGVVNFILKNEQHSGTGFFISSDILVTAFHVIERIKGPIRETLFFMDPVNNIPVPVTGILALDKGDDLALLKTEYQSETFYPVDFLDKTEDISASEKVILPGFPGGQFNLVQGKVGKSYERVIKIHITQMEKKMNSLGGMSGGPVFSEEGSLEGVMVMQEESLEVSVLEFVSITKLKDLLSEPILSCITNVCIDEEKGRFFSQALKGNKNNQFIIGHEEYQFAYFYDKELLEPLKAWLSPTINEEKKKWIERISTILFQKYKIVAHWFRLAAEQGQAQAQFYLGRMYARGKGIEKNLGS